jgi:nitrogen fixation protein FixH
VISLSFEPALAEKLAEGKVTFFRASSARYDQEVPLTLNEEHRFAVKSDALIKGAWTMQLFWSDGEMSFTKRSNS